MSGQRIWRRVDDPQTFRGHALEATLGERHFYAWENLDGTWSVSINGSAPVSKESFAEVRRAAEPTQGPRALARNPLHPAIAWAAASGMALAMRTHLVENPGSSPPPRDFRCESELAVLGVLGQVGLAGTSYLVRRPQCDRYGNVWMMVRPGFGRAARRAVRRAKLPFPVKIMESPR